jgi:hypothetical protein
MEVNPIVEGHILMDVDHIEKYCCLYMVVIKDNG